LEDQDSLTNYNGSVDNVNTYYYNGIQCTSK